MIRKLILGSLLIIPIVQAQEVSSELESIATFEELSQHITHESNGAIRAVRDSGLSFKINKKKMVATPIMPDDDVDLIHSLYETDVLKVIQNEGAEDFASAKKNFYGRQIFSRATQRYSRPYVYPSDWLSLFHSPIRKIDLPNEVYGRQFASLDNKSIEKSPLLNVELHQKLDDLTKTEMTAGNKLRLLSNGENSFKEKLRMVKESKKFFFSVVMVQYCDDSGSQIVDAMIERAQAGVDVRLSVESVWTKLILKKCLRRLEKGGVKVTLGKGFFNPKTMFTVHHTKYWVRDGEEAIIGGQNMHDFENYSNGFNRHDRDKDVHISKGPAVTDLVKEYIRIWNQERKRPDPEMEKYKVLVAEKEAQERVALLRGKDLYESWLNREASEIPGVCRVLIQGTKTTESYGIISYAYLEIMKNVKYSMFINTPHLNYVEKKSNSKLNAMVIKAILDSGARGVKVDLVSNGIDGAWGETTFQIRAMAKKLRKKGLSAFAFIIETIDRTASIFVNRSNRKHLAKMIHTENVDVWTYFNHIHSKQMMFDQIMTSTGSFNLDAHSYKNHESTMICLDKKLAEESLTNFVSDVVNSAPVL